jgi:hypothetical protein
MYTFERETLIYKFDEIIRSKNIDWLQYTELENIKGRVNHKKFV